MMATPIHPPNRPVIWNDVPATDAVDRPRSVSSYHRNDHVVLVTPPGEAAVMHPDDARTLADRLNEHADAIDSRPPGRVLTFPRR